MSTRESRPLGPRTIETEEQPAPVVELRTVSGLIERDARRQALLAERANLAARIAALRASQPVASRPAVPAPSSTAPVEPAAPPPGSAAEPLSEHWLKQSDEALTNAPTPLESPVDASEPAAESPVPVVSYRGVLPPPAFAPPPPVSAETVAEPSIEPSERVDTPALSESLTAENWAEVIDRAYAPLADRASELTADELSTALHAIRSQTEALKARDPSFVATADTINAYVTWAVDKWADLKSLPKVQDRQDKIRQWWRSIDVFVFNLDKVSSGSSTLDTLLISALLDVQSAFIIGDYGSKVERIATWAGQPFKAGEIERDTTTAPQPVPPDHPDWSGRVAGWPEPGNGGLKIDGQVLIFSKQPYFRTMLE